MQISLSCPNSPSHLIQTDPLPAPRSHMDATECVFHCVIPLHGDIEPLRCTGGFHFVSFHGNFGVLVNVRQPENCATNKTTERMAPSKPPNSRSIIKSWRSFG